VTLSFLYRAFWRALQLIRLIGRGDTDLAVEVVMLRHEMAVFRRQVHRPALEPADRAMLAGLARLLSRRRLRRFFARPETLLIWHRDLVAKGWTYPHGRRSPAGSRLSVGNLSDDDRVLQPGAVSDFNRRSSASPGLLFYRLLSQTVEHDAVSFRELVAAPAFTGEDCAPTSFSSGHETASERQHHCVEAVVTGQLGMEGACHHLSLPAHDRSAVVQRSQHLHLGPHLLD
jgi:hypothetical protein